jgi:hypothetical protein
MRAMTGRDLLRGAVTDPSGDPARAILTRDSAQHDTRAMIGDGEPATAVSAVPRTETLITAPADLAEAVNAGIVEGLLGGDGTSRRAGSWRFSAQIRPGGRTYDGSHSSSMIEDPRRTNAALPQPSRRRSARRASARSCCRCPTSCEPADDGVGGAERSQTGS